jgi:hypothetical protein
MATEAKRESERPGVATVEPYVIAVPDLLAEEIHGEVTRMQARLGGEHVDHVRRCVEIAVLKRGIAALRGEEGKR